MTREEWRVAIEDINIFYAPIDMLGDWEDEVKMLKDLIKEQEALLKESYNEGELWQR